MDTKKLRQKILDLAIRGKLVPQDPNDEPASVLLERIKAEKEQLIKAGKIKRSKKSASSDTFPYENVPFEIPESWVWCKLDDLAFYKKGPFGSSLTKSMFIAKNVSAYKVYEQKNAIQKDAFLGHYYISKEKFDELKNFAVRPNDIIVSCAGTIGETYVLPKDIEPGIINQALMVIRLYNRIIMQFYLLYFDSILKTLASEEGKGTAIKNIPPFDVLKNFYFPLPPKEEQKRIIEAVKEWFAIIDTIEQESIDLEIAIKRTKSKILNLAIHGKLVPQNPNDDPAINLLRRINPDFKPCDNAHYPSGWVQCALSDIFNITMGQSPTGDSINNSGGIEFHQGKIYFTDIYISKSNIYTSSPTKIAERDSLLLCVRAPVGDVNISSRDICIGRGLCSLKPKDGNLKFYFYLFKTMQDEFEQQATGSTFKAISGNIIKNTKVILPPKNEQSRIVKRVEELFATLDKIKESLEA